MDLLEFEKNALKVVQWIIDYRATLEEKPVKGLVPLLAGTLYQL